MRSLTDQVAQRIKALAAAPVGETYSGPVLFEGDCGRSTDRRSARAATHVARRPIAEPGPAPVMPSEFEGRIGSRVLPEFLDVVDDPSQKTWNDTHC